METKVNLAWLWSTLLCLNRSRTNLVSENLYTESQNNLTQKKLKPSYIKFYQYAYIKTWIVAASCVRYKQTIFFKYYRVKHFSNRILSRWDSPLINYSVFCHPPQLFSSPRFLILENFVSLPFYSRLPVYYLMRTVDSGSVKPRQSNKTVWCTCFFYISMTFIRIYRLRFGGFLSIFICFCMNFSILTMFFSVNYCKTFSFWFVKNAAK